MAGETPIPTAVRPNFIGPLCSGNCYGGGENVSVFPLMTADVPTVIDRIVLLKFTSQSMTIDVWRHNAGQSPTDGVRVVTQASGIGTLIPLVLSIDKLQNRLEAGQALTIVFGATPSTPVSYRVWGREGVQGAIR